MRRNWILVVFVLVSLTACGGGGRSAMTSPVAQTPQPAETQPASSQPAQSSQSSSDLPRDTASSVGVPQTEVDAVLDHIFIDAATQAAVVSKNGVIIGERYADGYDAKSLGTSWSVAKSFYSAAMGVAIAEGHFASVAEKASIVLDEFVGTDKDKQILRMRLGLLQHQYFR